MMNAKQIIIAGTLLVSVASFAQKDELKALKKIYAKEIPSANDMIEYKANLSKLETLASEEGDKVYTGFYKAMLPIMEITALGQNITQVQMMKFVNQKSISDLEVGLNATLDYEKKTGKKIQTQDIKETIASYKPQLMNYVVALGESKKFKEASDVLYSIYKMDNTDVEKLYYAAGYAVNGKDYDAALKYYQELKKLNYSGEATLYYAVNLASDKEESFTNKVDRDNLVNLIKTHNKPREEKSESKRGEIYKNIALILVDKGQTDEAKAAITEARKLNPTDSSLLITEADLYFKINDMDSYKRLIGEALQQNPNDVNLLFNLGVVSGNANQVEEAEKYYKKVIEIDPNYVNAYLNLSELTLRADEKYVEEMNKLGNTPKDTKRYEVLKLEREKTFKKVLPLLTKAVDLDDKNEASKRALMSVYNALDMTEEYKALKAKL